MAETTITTTGITTTTSTTTTITITITTPTSTETPTPAPAEAPVTGTLPAPAPAEAPVTGTLPAPEETGAIAPATALQKMQDSYEKAVEYCINLDIEEFASLIMWAKHRHNRFPAYAVELRDVVNADDVYKGAIVRICEPLGEEVVRKAIKLVDTKKILDLSEYLKYVKTIVEEWGDI